MSAKIVKPKRRLFQSRKGPAVRLSPRFSDTTTERRFQARSIRAALFFARLSLLAGVLFYDLFGVADRFLVPQQTDRIEAVRLLVVTPLFLGIFAFSYSRRFIRVYHQVVCFALLAAGASLIYFAAITPYPASDFYLFGICALILYSTLLTFSYVTIAISSLVIFLSYQVVALAGNPAPLGPTIMGELFLVFAICVAIVGAYIRELDLRRDFATAEKLRREHARSLALVREAEAANRAKDEFLAHMGHELRTPLNAIIGFSEVMKERVLGPLGSGRYESYIADIHASGQRLLGVVNDILDIAQASAGTIMLREEEVDPDALLAACVALYHERAAAKAIPICVRAPAPQPLLQVDATRLQQTLTHLIGNAVKFTGEGGAISVSAAVSDVGYRIAVSDTGVGIPPPLKAEVVKPFAGARDVYRGGNNGAGVGLALAKALVEAHGGALMIESEVGVGTTVVIVLPGHRVRARPSAS